MDQQDNPYRPPASPVRDVGMAATFGPAGRWRRFGTLILDYGGYLALSFVVGIVIALAFGPRSAATASLMRPLPRYAIGCLVYLGYYLVFEGMWARTPGKWVFGTVVTDEGGSRPTFKQVLGRTACRFIPFEAFSFLTEGPGWHDRIPKTRVMRCR